MIFRILPISLAGVFALCMFFSERSTAEDVATSIPNTAKHSTGALPVDEDPIRSRTSQIMEQFPDKIGNFQRGKLTKYKDELGVSIGYNAHGMIATIYLLGGSSQVNNGVTAQIVKDEFSRAARQLESFEDSGLYRSLQKTSFGEKSFKKQDEDTVDYLAASYEYDFVVDKENDETRRLSSGLLVTGYKNRVLKIRLTRRQFATLDEIESMDHFLRELNKVVL